MAEKVAKLGVNREKDFMYYVKDGAAWKVQRKQPGIPKGKPEMVAEGGFQMDTNYIYFVDKDGDVSRAKRAVGGQKRKKSTAGGGRAKAKRAAKPAARTAGKAAAGGKKKAAKPASRTSSKSAKKPSKPASKAAKKGAKPAASKAAKKGTKKTGRR